MARALSDWISFYLEYTDDTEPPESYHIWTAISLIAGSLERKVCMPWGHSKIYPNLYVILVGPSGRTRKGVAMDIGSDIFIEAGGKTTADSMTKERLIQVFKNSIDNYENPATDTIEFHCSLTTFSKELSVFLGQKDIGFIADLTDWYDSHDSWKYETKNGSRDHIKGICYNLLAGTASDWFASMLPLEAIGGGFTARIIFVSEENKKKTVSRPKISDANLRKVLISELQKIKNLAGEYHFTTDAEQAYVDWYEREDAKMAKGQYPISDPRFNSYCERRATHIKKLSMAVTASHTDKLIIELDDFNRALSILEKTEKKMYRVFGGLGASLTGPVLQKIIMFLAVNKKVKRSQLMDKFKFDITTIQLQEMEAALSQMKYIKVEIIANGSDRLYTYVGPPLT